MRGVQAGCVVVAILAGLAVDADAQEEGEVSGGAAPAEAEAEVGLSSEPERPLFLDFDVLDINLHLSLADRVEGVSSFPIDAEGTEFEADPAFNAQIRVGGELTTKRTLAPVRLGLVYEHDLLTGTHAGGFEGSDSLGVDFPTTNLAETQLRKAYGQVDVTHQYHLLGGVMTSYWGMGLIANDGAHGWEPGSALFIDPRGGDIVLRGVLGFGPFTDRRLFAAVAADQVVDDDVLQPGEDAWELIGSVVLGYGGPDRIGAYVVVRRQSADDGAYLDVQVVDLAGATDFALGDRARLVLEGEAAFIWGETTLSPSTEFPVHDVLQFGAAVRAGLDLGDFGAVLDFLFASGDDNPDDDRLTAFKADVNYPSGLLLYRYVVAAQTARAVATAGNPELVGVPAEDLERLATGGAATNTVAFFPRLWWRPVTALEIYGGPLLALSAEAVADPYNSRLAGGDPRNALGGEPGRYLGTELDLGIRYSPRIGWTQLRLAVEGGVLFPGSAFDQPDGDRMGAVSGGRAIVDFRF